MSHLNQSLHSLEEDHLQKPYIMSVLATIQTHWEDLKGYPPALSSRLLSLGPIKHWPDTANMFNIQIVSNMVTDAWQSYLKSDSLFHAPTMDGFPLKKSMTTILFISNIVP